MENSRVQNRYLAAGAAGAALLLLGASTQAVEYAYTVEEREARDAAVKATDTHISSAGIPQDCVESFVTIREPTTFMDRFTLMNNNRHFDLTPASEEPCVGVSKDIMFKFEDRMTQENQANQDVITARSESTPIGLGIAGGIGLFALYRQGGREIARRQNPHHIGRNEPIGRSLKANL